jgi:hypothetical protein
MFVKVFALLVVIGSLLLAGVSGAASFVLNNGLVPPNPANVIDDGTYSSDSLYIRNVGCPPGWPFVLPGDPCPTPGAFTGAELAENGSVDRLHVYDSSTLSITGGGAYNVYAVNSSVVTMTEGMILNELSATNSSDITISGGMVGNFLSAYDTSTILVEGGNIWELRAYDFSSVEMTAGSVGFLNAYDSSIILMDAGVVEFLDAHSTSLTLDGGAVTWLALYGASTLTLTTGSVGGNLNAWGTSAATLDGGTVAGSLQNFETSSTVLDGGEVVNLHGFDSATAEVHSGTVTGDVATDDLFTITLDGGVVSGELKAAGSSVITLIGSGFMVDALPIPYGNMVPTTGILTGTLANGDPVDSRFYHAGYPGYTGTIVVPEPNALFVLGGGVLLLGLMAKGRNRHGRA